MGSAASAPPRLSALLVVGIPLTSAHRTRLQPFFSTIRHCPDRKAILENDLKDIDTIFGELPPIVKQLRQVENLRFIQLPNAGSDVDLRNPIWKEERAVERIQMATAAGVHTGPIPQHFIMTVLALFHRLQAQILIGQNEKRWSTDNEIGGRRMFIQELRGKMVGVIGYGHIGREAARLAHAFGATIIVASSNGKQKPQEGYIIPGTGDPDGSLPSAWFSTKDGSSFSQFLSKVDVLLLSLPSTPATKHILNATTLSYIKPTAIVANVGRGDAIDTDALVSALDSKALAGAALDVTEPEPLPQGHPLYGRLNVVLTPHLCGRTEVYFDIAVDIFVRNLERWNNREELLNLVDVKRGY